MSTFQYVTTAADLWGNSSDGIIDTDDILEFGALSSGGQPDRVWIPFVVNLPKIPVVTSAYLKIVGAQTRSDVLDLKFGCEAVDNAVAPANWGDLSAKPFTTAVTFTGIATNVVAGTEYLVDIRTAVQEILNRAGWAFGNTIAVLAVDDGTSNGDFHRFAAFEHVTYAAPILEITFDNFIPRASAG